MVSIQWRRSRYAALVTFASTLVWLSPFLPRAQAIAYWILHSLGLNCGRRAVALKEWQMNRLLSAHPATFTVIVPVHRAEPPQQVLQSISDLVKAANKSWRIHLCLCLSPRQGSPSREDGHDTFLQKMKMLMCAAQGALGVYAIDVVSSSADTRGRGAALAAGLERATKFGSAIVVFHHVDVRLSRNWDDAIEQVLVPSSSISKQTQRPVIMTAFSFGVRCANSKNRFLSIQTWANLRSKCFWLPFGE